MTATPHLYDDPVKGKTRERSAELAFMDGEVIYVPVGYRLDCDEALESA